VVDVAVEHVGPACELGADVVGREDVEDVLAGRAGDEADGLVERDLGISAVPSRSDSAPSELSSETTSAGSMSFSPSSIGPSSARRAREMKDFPVPLVANRRFWPFGESFPSSSMIGPMCLALMLRQASSFAVVFI
jgi:hypothetical protein